MPTKSASRPVIAIMLQILKLNRIFSFLMKCALIAALIWQVIPRLPGCSVNAALPLVFLGAIIFELYADSMNKAVYLVLSQAFVWAI
ncbi:MAG: hypothetical protein K2Z81_23465, partial [Cyanobacteria bacterium]|nr:hypothetical protein [Cyanobacteriota bacterium]